jgi:hypothetical protein
LCWWANRYQVGVNAEVGDDLERDDYKRLAAGLGVPVRQDEHAHREHGEPSHAAEARICSDLHVKEELEVVTGGPVLVVLAGRHREQRDLAAKDAAVDLHRGAVQGRHGDRVVSHASECLHMVVGDKQDIVAQSHLIQARSDEGHKIVCYTSKGFVETDE